MKSGLIKPILFSEGFSRHMRVYLYIVLTEFPSIIVIWNLIYRVAIKIVPYTSSLKHLELNFSNSFITVKMTNKFFRAVTTSSVTEVKSPKFENIFISISFSKRSILPFAKETGKIIILWKNIYLLKLSVCFHIRKKGSYKRFFCFFQQLYL